ncbi:MAG: ABC transporter ATP-binding protein [Chloroflexota bacterium]|nr:MAG: ABC transporter ATP-binding protein [Chloroflexota bacterium]
MIQDIRLQANNLSRSFGAYQALKPVDLSLSRGEIAVLQGPNGSGKSTLLLCLSGLLRPTTGEIRVGGFDLYRDERQARRLLAFVPDVPVFYQELTAWEHLVFVAHAHSAGSGFAGRAEKLLVEFGLWEARDLYPHAYSRGMRLKLGLALALIRPFGALLLDEPTSALDGESASLLCEKLKALAGEGAAVLLSTHNPGMEQQLGAQVWTMQHGLLNKQ